MRTLLLMTAALLLSSGPLVPQAPDTDGDVTVAFESRTVGGDASSILDRPARLQVENMSLAGALDRLQATSGVPIAYSPTALPRDRRVVCDCAEATVRDAVETLLEGTGFGFVVAVEQLVIRRETRRSPDLRLGDLLVGPAVRAADLSTQPGPVDLVPVNDADQLVGVITGEVQSVSTGQPLASVQVFIPELDLGVLTQQNGRFILQDVPAGTHNVTAERLGYRPVTREVTVGDDETVVLDFSLEAEALQLDEVIVTGTPGGTQRRAIGNVVGRVDASAITESSTVRNIQDLLTAREPGVSFTGASGIIGGGRQVRIRGTSSLSMTQQPLIFVDGIRVDNEPTTGPNIRQGPMTSKLDDFNPDEIESIEIIKGPAAATLYGTEASAGVIQIITKRGETGAPQFDLTIRQGGNYLANAEWKVGDACMMDPGREATPTPSSYWKGDVFCHNLVADEKDAGRPIFTTGPLQAYNLAIRGGTDAVRYFVSGEWERNQGMVEYNWDRRMNFRANLGIVANENWSIDMSSGFVDGFTSYMQQVSGSGLWENTRWGNPLTLGTDLRGFLRATPEAIADASATREFRRFTGSATITHTPFEGFTHRMTLGTDLASDVNIRLMPRHPLGAEWFFGGQSLGEKDVRRPTTRFTTVDYAATYAFDLNPSISLSTSAGVQYYGRKLEETRSEGRVFASPAITSLAGAASTLATEIHDENVSLGVYFQQEVALRDNIFLTAAVRGDDNSAFGANFDAVIYPKFSGTWVVTDEDFWGWDDYVNSLRFRSAWGKAGRQPSTFAAVTLFEPEVGPGGSSSVLPDVLGNADVGPEVSTELEVGFDIAALDDRLTGEFTYYTQQVEDALLEVPVASSSGFGGSQAVNLGRMDNWGWEIGLGATLVRRENVIFDLGWSWSHADNEIVDLGGVPPTQIMREGFYFPSWFNYDPVSAEFSEDGNVDLDSVMCSAGVDVMDGYGLRGGVELVPCAEAPFLHFGPQSIPKDEMAFDVGLTLFGDLRISAVAEYRGEAHMGSSEAGCQFSCYPRPEAAVNPTDPLVASLGVVRQLGFDGRYALLRHRTDFVKLRDLSARYQLPTSIVQRTGASRAAISVSGRNLWTIWQYWDYTPFNDPRGATIPDMENRQVNPTSRNMGNPAVPPMSSFSVTMQVSF